MTAVPHLDDDGHNTIVIPSEWYSRDAARFCKSHGFEWRQDRHLPDALLQVRPLTPTCGKFCSPW